MRSTTTLNQVELVADLIRAVNAERNLPRPPIIEHRDAEREGLVATLHAGGNARKPFALSDCARNSFDEQRRGGACAKAYDAGIGQQFHGGVGCPAPGQ